MRINEKRVDDALRRVAAAAGVRSRGVAEDVALVERALRAERAADEAEVWDLARTLWASWRGVDGRGFNATSSETKEQWLAVARQALDRLGYEVRDSGTQRYTNRRSPR